MDFSYKNYVKRFSYKPFEWPPDISLAELHSRCSEPGPENPKGVRCPCCNMPTKKKIQGWLWRDIYEDFKDWGSGIPAYFGLMRFYNIIAFIVFLVNAIYPLYVTYVVCNYDNTGDICVQIGVLRYLAFKEMKAALVKHGQQGIVDTLMILQTVVFYVLLIANNLSIFYLVWINRRCKKKVESAEKYLTLLVENLPYGTTQQSLTRALNLNPSDIKSITFIKEIKRFSQIYKDRIRAYFELKALYVQGVDPKKSKILNQRLRKLEKEYLAVRQISRLKNEKAIVVFRQRDTMLAIKNTFRLPEHHHWKYGVMSFFKANVMGQVFVSAMPDIQETQWANLGQNHTHKMRSKITTFAICIILIVLCYGLFYYPLKFSLSSHSASVHSAHLTLAEKFLPALIALLMMAMSVGFRMYMEVLASRRNPKTYLEHSKFVLATTVMFHLIFYLLIPTIFFVTDNGINQSIKLYTVAQQAQTFIIIQLLLSWLDFVFRMWRVKKINALSDQRQSFKFPQKFLHERVQYREFPLELKLIVMFKIWSFALFYAFFLPYITFLISLAMICLYLLEKRNLYSHYSQRRYLGVELEIKFLNIYINFFCIYECLIYILNVQSNWQRYAAIISTVLSLLLQLIYWMIIQKRLQVRREKLLKKVNIVSTLADEQIKKPQLNASIMDRAEKMLETDNHEDEEMVLQALSVSGQTYDEAYKEYLMTFYHPELDLEIRKYMQILDEYDENFDSSKEQRDVNQDETQRNGVNNKHRPSQIQMIEAKEQ